MSIVMVLLGLVGLILQSTVFNHLQIAGVKPDIMIILVIFYSIFHGQKKGVAFALFLGIMEDLFLGRFIGMNGLALAVTALVFGWLSAGAFRENLLVPILFVLLGTIFNSVIVVCLGKVVGLQWSWTVWLWKGVPMAIYNGCLVPLFYTQFYNWAVKNEENEAI